MHKCNSDDFSKMKAPSIQSSHRIQQLNETESLFCLDKKDMDGNPVKMQLYGNNDNVPHRRIEVIYMPCLTYKERMKNKENVTCKGSLDNFEEIKQETETYLKDAELVVVYNHATFNTSRFGGYEDVVSWHSRTWSIVFDASQPSWIHALLKEQKIDDETDWFNSGYSLRQSNFSTLEFRD